MLLAPGGDGAGEGGVLGKGPTETGHWQRGWTRAGRDGSGRARQDDHPCHGVGDKGTRHHLIWGSGHCWSSQEGKAQTRPGSSLALSLLQEKWLLAQQEGLVETPVMPTPGEPGTTLGSDAWEAVSPRSGTRGTRCHGC